MSYARSKAIEGNIDKQLVLMRWMAGQITEPPVYVRNGLAAAMARLEAKGWAKDGTLTLRGRQYLNTVLSVHRLPLVEE